MCVIKTKKIFKMNESIVVTVVLFFFFGKKIVDLVYSVEIQLFLLPIQTTRNIESSQTILLKTYVLNINTIFLPR